MKVAIVCGAPSSEFLAPFSDPDWQIWVLGNRLNRFLDRNLRVTRAFEIHDDLSEHRDIDKYVDWLLDKNLPMTVSEKFPRLTDNTTIFDYNASEALYGSLYLTSSPAYMMSQAISEGATHIGVYGVDLAVDDHEYFWQRPCIEAWIGFAKGRGIEVTIPAVSNVGRADYQEGRHWDGQKNEYNARKTARAPFTQLQFKAIADQHAAKIAEAQAAIQIHSGAQQAYERLAKIARATESGIEIKNLSDSFALK